MSVSRFAGVRSLVVVAALAVPSWADTKMKIASVHPEYTPLTGAQAPEALSVQGYRFEIDKGTNRARVVIHYSFASQPLGFDAGAGPAPSAVQIPGLRYDAASEKVMYTDQSGRSVVCASVSDQKLFFWTRTAVVSTGACKVRSQTVVQTKDNGWSFATHHTLDTFFEVD